MVTRPPAQSVEDVKAGIATSAIPLASAGKDAVMEAATASVFAQMDNDRKTTALKSLQVISWPSHCLSLLAVHLQRELIRRR
jgi:methionine salvage enolase-phosphatase E1